MKSVPRLPIIVYMAQQARQTKVYRTFVVCRLKDR